VTILLLYYDAMHTEICNLLGYKYFNPMEYTVYLNRKKRTDISSVGLTCKERKKPLCYHSATTGEGVEE